MSEGTGNIIDSGSVDLERSRKPFLPLRTLATSNSLNGIMESGRNLVVGSPMSCLAHNLSELSTGRGTPKRRLSMSSIDTPTGTNDLSPEQNSTESGCFMDSPTPIDSPTLEMSLNQFGSLLRGRPDIPAEAYTKKKTIAFRRINSLPLPTMRLDSPTDFLEKENSTVSTHSEGSDLSDGQQPAFYLEDTCSQDSGLGSEREKDYSSQFQFAAPVGVPPRKLKIINEDACSPKKYSPVKSPKKRSFSESFPSSSSSESYLESTVHLSSSVATSHDDDIDDGFLEIWSDQEVSESSHNNMENLFSAPVINSLAEDDDTPQSRRTFPRRNLCRSQSFDIRCRVPTQKRVERCGEESQPVQNKRRRPESVTNVQTYFKPIVELPEGCKLHRCHSESEAQIKSALNRLNEEPDLIGDCTKPYCLPSFTGKHRDLKGISPDTMGRLLDGAYDDRVCHYVVVDCRYPYEFDGGHIKDAKNLFTKESILKEFMHSTPHDCSTEKRHILIFHCEFSSERGPNLSRFLRNNDRETNKETYPALRYPELYLLEGGYKAFFQDYQHLCEPQLYKPMLHKEHTEDLRHFRAKSKSWAGEKAAPRTGLRSLKF